jgi:hypothetical protein
MGFVVLFLLFLCLFPLYLLCVVFFAKRNFAFWIGFGTVLWFVECIPLGWIIALDHACAGRTSETQITIIILIVTGLLIVWITCWQKSIFVECQENIERTKRREIFSACPRVLRRLRNVSFVTEHTNYVEK